MPKDIDRQVEGLRAQLKREFDAFPAGTRIPSTRELLKKHSCSRQTLDRALSSLTAEGFLRSEERRGIFTAQELSREVKRIAFLRVDWACEHAQKFSDALEAEMAKRQSYSFFEQRYPPEKLASFVDGLSANAGALDLAILWLENLAPAKTLSLLSCGFPAVFFDCGIMLSGLNILDLQEEMMGMLAAEHLLKAGHRKIALLITEPKGLTCMKTAYGFLDRLRLAGVEPKVIDMGVEHGEASRSKACDFVMSYFKRNRLDFSACFAMSDYSAFGVMKAFQDMGLRIPEDLSVVGCHGEMEGERSSPPLTTVLFDTARAAKELAAGIDELFAGGVFGTRRVPPMLIERGSVRRI